MKSINLSINGRAFLLPQCQALFDSNGNVEANGQKAIAIVQRAAASGQLTNAQNQFIEAAENLQGFVENLMPQVMNFAFNGYTEDEINAFITQTDNDALPLVRALITAVDAVITEAGV